MTTKKNIRIGWRVVIAHITNGKPTHMESAYTKESLPWPKNQIQDHRGFHVGTLEKFCLDYYTGMIDPEPQRKEVLLELEIQRKDLQKPNMWERWDIPCGTEAVATKAKILNTTIL